MAELRPLKISMLLASAPQETGVSAQGSTTEEHVKPQDIDRAFSAAEKIDPGSEMPEAGQTPIRNKIADSEEAPTFLDRASDFASGVSGGLLGGMAGSAAIPQLHGRTTYYHGTDPLNVPEIFSQGIRPAADTGNHGITRLVLGDEIASQPLAYVTPFPEYAEQYARFAPWYRENPKPTPLPGETPGAFGRRSNRWDEAMMGALHGDAGSKRGRIPHTPEHGVLEISMPYVERMARERPNPEVAWQRARGLPHAAQSIEDNTRAILGGVAPEHIKGHKGYKGVTPSEIFGYAKANPKGFATGLGFGLVGLGGLAYGGKKIYDAFKPAKEPSMSKESAATAAPFPEYAYYQPQEGFYRVSGHVPHTNVFDSIEPVGDSATWSPELQSSLRDVASQLQGEPLPAKTRTWPLATAGLGAFGGLIGGTLEGGGRDTALGGAAIGALGGVGLDLLRARAAQRRHEQALANHAERQNDAHAMLSKLDALGKTAALRTFGLEKLADAIAGAPLPKVNTEPAKPPKPVPAFDSRTDKPPGYGLVSGVQTMSHGADVNDSYGAFSRRLQGSPV